MANTLTPEVPAERRGIKLALRIKRDPLAYFTRLMREEGPFAWYALRGQRILMLNDATGIEHVLQHGFEKYRRGRYNGVLKPLLGNGIFLSEGSIWWKQRQETAPVFAGGNFPEMTQQMVGAADAMLQRWGPRIARGEPIDFNVEAMWYTLDVVLRALFHEAKDGIAADVKAALGVVLKEAESRIWAPFSLPQNWVMRLPKYRMALEFLRGIVESLIAERRANGAYPEDLLSRLIASYGHAPEEQSVLRDQLISFLAAGHETTANGLAWAFYQLSLHPHVMREMTAEIDSILGGKPPTHESVKALTYTRQVFDETLRLHPPAWTMSRDALEDDLVPLEDGRRISVPKGSVVMMCTYAVHRRDIYWENPEAFDPDRFSPAAVAGRPRFAWFPFGGGPRLCIGFRLAQIESIVAMAMIAQRYRLVLVPGQDIRPEPIITLRPSGQMLFHVRERAPETRLPAYVQLGAVAAAASGKCPFHHQGGTDAEAIVHS